MPCALFIGVNNYGKTVLFGSALLRNETIDTFRWLMKTFVTTMKKSPKTIITDQDKWMSEATAIEMPTTKHSYYIWHITSKFNCWFTVILCTEYQNWCRDFYVLYRMTSIVDFEQNWFLICKKGMSSTQRSESINGVIKSFVSSHTSLREFVKQFDLVVEEMRSRQMHDYMLATLNPTSLKTKSPLERQAYEVLTPFAFRKFQEEFERASLYLINRFNGNEFLIRYYEEGNHKLHSAYWDGYTASCSCKNFEFLGILCRHILRVLIHKDCFILSHEYLPRRWCFDSLQNDNVVENISIPSLDNSPLIPGKGLDKGKEILCPPRSKTKGRPKNNRRLKSGKELASKTRNRCSICKQIGHTKPTCSCKEKIIDVGRASSNLQANLKNDSKLTLGVEWKLRSGFVVSTKRGKRERGGDRAMVAVVSAGVSADGGYVLWWLSGGRTDYRNTSFWCSLYEGVSVVVIQVATIGAHDCRERLKMKWVYDFMVVI
ncbi:protein FAR1-RELATED SEQUENCE 11-like [Rutidosis leptorrhynchoides]|uniref:protein FAR1-RELATED SEQUENCE 11-like n=1 Tax=Rutidosis leptorrhynchoides TaxID=125765 RepID=UPI003A994166